MEEGSNLKALRSSCGAECNSSPSPNSPRSMHTGKRSGCPQVNTRDRDLIAAEGVHRVDYWSRDNCNYEPSQCGGPDFSVPHLIAPHTGLRPLCPASNYVASFALVPAVHATIIQLSLCEVWVRGKRRQVIGHSCATDAFPALLRLRRLCRWQQRSVLMTAFPTQSRHRSYLHCPRHPPRRQKRCWVGKMWPSECRT
jgi:hypothetical protein